MLNKVLGQIAPLRQCYYALSAHWTTGVVAHYAEQSLDGSSVDMAVAAAQQAAALRAAESRAQAAMMVEAVEDRAYEVQLFHSSL